MLSKKWGDRFYEMRMLMSFSLFSHFEIRDVITHMDLDMILPLPIYAAIAGVSVSELDYERINLRVKPEYHSRQFYKDMKKELKKWINDFKEMTPAEDLTYNNFFLLEAFEIDDKDHLERQARSMDQIFYVIIVITMSLCFFSLSSSMSANIFDQAKQIAVLRSIGVTRSMVIRIYIYEALVLVISCSICGFFIGAVTGNMMILQ